MILDKLENASLYAPLGLRFAAAFEFLRREDLATLPAGRYEIQTSDVFALVQDNVTKLGLTTYEAHRKYADIQYLVRGFERMGYANLEQLKVAKPYDENDDYLLAEGGGGTLLEMRAGLFAIFFPQDAHIPNMAAREPSQVRKVVIKVRM